MNLSEKLKGLEAAQAALLDTINRLAVLNHLLREAEFPQVSMPQLGMCWHSLDEATFETEAEINRLASKRVPA